MQVSDLLTKPIEFYVAIAAAAIYVWESNSERPLVSRFAITTSSAMFGFSLGATFASYARIPEILASFIVTALGFLLLEIATALIADREYVKEIIKRRLGGGSDG